jgi:hypothetical protein
VQEPLWKDLVNAVISVISGRHWWAVLIAIGLLVGLPLVVILLLHILGPSNVPVSFEMPWVRYRRGNDEAEENGQADETTTTRWWRRWWRRWWPWRRR